MATDDRVLDASVAVKCFITESGSDEARAMVRSSAKFVAPEFIYAEIASVLVKRTLRGDIDRTFADEVIGAAPGLFDETFAIRPLTARAQELAFDPAEFLSMKRPVRRLLFSGESQDMRVLTADAKLVERLRGTPLERVVDLLSLEKPTP